MKKTIIFLMILLLLPTILKAEKDKIPTTTTYGNISFDKEGNIIFMWP